MVLCDEPLLRANQEALADFERNVKQVFQDERFSRYFLGASLITAGAIGAYLLVDHFYLEEPLLHPILSYSVLAGSTLASLLGIYSLYESKKEYQDLVDGCPENKF